MKSWHPDSWSEQARKMAKSMYEQYVFYTATGDDESAKWCEDFFSRSYRAPIICHRAAKRFGKMKRKSLTKDIERAIIEIQKSREEYERTLYR